MPWSPEPLVEQRAQRAVSTHSAGRLGRTARIHRARHRLRLEAAGLARHARRSPRPASGYGEVRPTPPVMRNRRWTLPDTVPMLPGRGFAAKVRLPAPPSVIARSSWVEPGCPVAATDLAWIRLTFWGFDAQRHTGELLVHRTVADDIVGVFRTLYRQRFPQEQVGDRRARSTRTRQPRATATGPGRSCAGRSPAASYFSQHAYGLAIDVNTFQNPYDKGDVVLPELARLLPAPRPRAARDDRAGRAGDRGVRAHRLGVGRRLERSRRTTSTSARTADDPSG